MKRTVILLLFLCVSGLFAEDVLFFCGGTTWGAGQLQKRLAPGGATVKMVGPMDLAGQCGVSLKKYDSREPETKDGITPEFKQLKKYKVVFFAAIPSENLANILTAERVALLKEYLNQGGTLLLDNRAPASLGDILPVRLGKSVRDEGMEVVRPGLPAFNPLPKSWPKYMQVMQAEALPGTVNHCMLKDSSGKNIVGIASRKYGKGQVWFYNGQWRMQATEIKAFCHWAYNGAFINALLAEVGGLKLNIDNCIPKQQRPPEQKNIGALSYAFKELKNAFDTKGTVTLKGDKATFSNGVMLQLRKSGDVGAQFPGMKARIGHNVPTLLAAGKPQSINGDNNEAIIKSYNLKKQKIALHRASTGVKGNCVYVLLEDGKGARMRWEFMPCALTLDGRRYVGYGERVIMETLPAHLESVSMSSRVPCGKLRRMTCYTKPRGYLEGELGADGIRNSSIWQFFCSGQPFTYVASKDGIMADMVESPVPCYAQFTARKPGDELCNRILRLQAGYRKCPVELPIVWHLFSPGAEQGNNDYIALYQFIRQFLREKCGLKSFPQMTEACYYLHGRPAADLEASARVAQKLNFKSVWLSYCPLPLDQIGDEKLHTAMLQAKKQGLRPHPWTPGGYGHGTKQRVFLEHPEWFIRDRSGKFYFYFKNLTVFDFNVPEFRTWYGQLVDRACKNGMEAIYMDMGGQASSNVNFHHDDARPNLDGLVTVFQSFSRRNLPYSVEGMNPLAKDQALFAPEKSLPIIGREFAYVGGCPLISVDAGVTPLLYIDYFRLGMYNGTTNVNTDGYALGIERVPGEKALLDKIGAVNLVLNKAHAHVPVAFVRETPFGTAWIGTNTGALFFYHSVKKLSLTLPPGWRVEKGASLENISAGSVLLLTKEL